MKRPQPHKTTKAKHPAAAIPAAPAQWSAELPPAPKRLRIPKRHAIGFTMVETVQTEQVELAVPDREGKVIVPPSAKKRSKKHGKKS